MIFPASSLAHYAKRINLEGISQVRCERERALLNPNWVEVQKVFEDLQALTENAQLNISKSLFSDTVKVGTESELTEEQSSLVHRLIRLLIPWRKGPFSLFGHDIDAEWNSNLKWHRIAPHIPDLTHKRVVDIGCNNGYYLWRLLEKNPKFLLGLDPSERCYFQFHLFQHFIKNPSVCYELLGVEHMNFFPKFFHLALCLGVIYHQRNPLDMLQSIKHSLVEGGILICESIAIPGEEPVALFPQERYAKMRNVYFVPTVSCLESMLHRAGFKEIETFSVTEMTHDEQRKTAYAPFESLEDFLNPDDLSKTVEGFPAPLRVCVKAKRPE